MIFLLERAGAPISAPARLLLIRLRGNEETDRDRYAERPGYGVTGATNACARGELWQFVTNVVHVTSTLDDEAKLRYVQRDFYGYVRFNQVQS